MRLYVDIDSDTYEGIKDLVADGHYQDVNQFLRVAADNQLSLERSGQTGTEAPQTGLQPSQGGSPTAEAETGVAEDDPQESASGGYEWVYDPPQSPPTRSSMSDDRTEMLLFSQYYRFVPLKIALLELAQITTDVGGPVALEEFRDHMREAIVPIRDALVAWETAADIKKQDRFSTGLPKRDSKNPERSMKRYLDHYVGHFSTQAATPWGLGHQMGFVSIESADDEATIALSKAGMLFVSLENPLLANGPAQDRSSLSEDERNYIVSHVRRVLPLEYEFMEYVYDILDNHEGTYTDHMERYRLFLESAPRFTDDPRENQVRSHTAGTISRMVDLGLLERGTRRGEYETVRPPNAFRYPQQVGDDIQVQREEHSDNQ